MINKARALKQEDMTRVKEISKKSFPDLEIPDFMNGYYCAYAITDEDENIVIAGGLRPSAEILMVTDTDMSEIKIGRALIEAKNAALYVGHKFGLNELVAFVQNNDVYARHLVRHGFYPRNLALAIQVPKWDNQQKVQN